MSNNSKRKVRLTTIDNPYDIFTQFDDWYRFDNDHDYGTCELIARFAYTSNELSDAENEEEMERAIDDLIEHDVTKLYKKVVSDTNPV